MPDGDIFAVNEISCVGGGKAFGFNMKTDLMAEEVKINPCVRFAALRTSYDIAVKTPRLLFVFYGVGEMESRRHLGELFA